MLTYKIKELNISKEYELRRLRYSGIITKDVPRLDGEINKLTRKLNKLHEFNPELFI